MPEMHELERNPLLRNPRTVEDLEACAKGLRRLLALYEAFNSSGILDGVIASHTRSLTCTLALLEHPAVIEYKEARDGHSTT